MCEKPPEKRSLGNDKNACHRPRTERPNHLWIWDSIFDRTTSSLTLKCFTILDEYTRRCITLDISGRVRSEEILNRLTDLFVMYGTPELIRSDNGPAFIAEASRTWLGRLGVQTLYIEPGSPWEDGYAESFRSRVRDELFCVEGFSNVSLARDFSHAWLEDSNDYRPLSSLGGLPP